MASSWITTSIGEQATLQRGFDITRSQQREGNVPVVSSGGISSYHDTVAINGPGVVLGRKGVVGSVYFVNEDFWPHDTTLWVKDFHGNDRRFVYYFFLSMVPTIASMDVGSANPTLNRNHVHPIRISWPPLPEQRAIAHILGTLDDKIELNRRMNRTLEEMARALFRSWFVDFDPVRAKARGEAPHGLAPELAALFPDRLVETELGEAPEGWEIRPLRTVLDLKRDSLQPEDYPLEEFVYYSIPAFDAGYPEVESGGNIKSGKYKVYSGSVLLSKLNPRIPRIWLPTDHLNLRSICSTEFFVCVPSSGVTVEYLYSLFSSPSFLTQFEQLVSGTSGSHQRVNHQAFVNMRTHTPPAVLVQHYTELAAPMFDKISANLEESRLLSELRDTLLPKLMSGEVRMPEAAELAGV